MKVFLLLHVILILLPEAPGTFSFLGFRFIPTACRDCSGAQVRTIILKLIVQPYLQDILMSLMLMSVSPCCPNTTSTNTICPKQGQSGEEVGSTNTNPAKKPRPQKCRCGVQGLRMRRREENEITRIVGGEKSMVS